MRAYPPDRDLGGGVLDPARDGFDSRMQVGSLLPDRSRFVMNNPGDAVGDQTLTVSAATVGLTVPPDAVSALFQVTVAPIRWVVAGADPSATRGFRSDVNDVVKLLGRAQLVAWRAIREGAGDATLYVAFFG